jgi:hypothetical protein
MLKHLNSFKRKISIEVFKNETLKGVKDFKDIPGPKGIFGSGNFYNYTKAFGITSNGILAFIKIFTYYRKIQLR